MITFDPQELQEIIQAVSSADNTDAMPAHSWARASKVLLAEVERLQAAHQKHKDRIYEVLEIEDKSKDPYSLIEVVEWWREQWASWQINGKKRHELEAEVERLREALVDIRDENFSYHKFPPDLDYGAVDGYFVDKNDNPIGAFREEAYRNIARHALEGKEVEE